MAAASVTLVVLLPAAHELPCAPEDALRLSAQDPAGLGGLHADVESLVAALQERGGAVRLGQPLVVPVPGDLSAAVEALRKLVTP